MAIANGFVTQNNNKSLHKEVAVQQ